jgi:hypothetical protein
LSGAHSPVVEVAGRRRIIDGETEKAASRHLIEEPALHGPTAIKGQ